MSGREWDLRRLELRDDFKVGQCPNVPGLVPSWIERCGNMIVANQLGRIPLSRSVNRLERKNLTHWFVF
jgi:hypothetical protein